VSAGDAAIRQSTGLPHSWQGRMTHGIVLSPVQKWQLPQ
jgi:hypothetical protein